jgi:hypothetical protein
MKLTALVAGAAFAFPAVVFAHGDGPAQNSTGGT